MKKNKSEIILVLALLFFAVISLYLYKESKTVVTTAEIPYTESSNASYKVYLSDEKYYNKKYLDEGMQYISSIIDHVDIDFIYNADYKNTKGYKVDKNVTADVKIVDTNDDNKVIYSKSEVIKESSKKKELLDEKDTIIIDYKKYNNLTNDFKTSYGISAKCTLTINYSISYKDEKDVIKKNKAMSVEIPLSSQMININKSGIAQENSVYYGDTTDSEINRIMFILSIVFLVISVITLFILIMEILHRRKTESKYDRFIRKTLKEYDSYITEIKEENTMIDKQVINVNSFKELLDVRNNTEKTIVYIKIDENTSKFQLIDNEIYEYKVSRREMDE